MGEIAIGLVDEYGEFGGIEGVVSGGVVGGTGVEVEAADLQDQRCNDCQQRYHSFL